MLKLRKALAKPPMENPTEEQAVVANLTDGNNLVEACPGSGKTSTLALRCYRLPKETKILILAFNKLAATDFQKKVRTLHNVEVKTFHAFCLRQVMQNFEQYGFTEKPTLDTDSTYFDLICQANDWEGYGGWLKNGLSDEIAKEVQYYMYNRDLEEEIKTIEERNVQSQIDKIMEDARENSMGTDTKELQTLFEDRMVLKTLKAVKAMREDLVKRNVTTFSEMVRLVAEHPVSIFTGAEHVMVDEFQDVDKFQFDVIRKIANTKSLTVVGDPNQRIYGWRGALQNAFVSFAEVFPEVRDSRLTLNFRSTPEVVETAEKIIRVGMQAFRPSIGLPVSVVMDNWDSCFVKLMGTQDAKTDLSNNAIIARYNRTCFKWQIMLAKKNIPVDVKGLPNILKSEHLLLAAKNKALGLKSAEFFSLDEWEKFINKRKYRRNPELASEVKEDVSWFWGLTPQEENLIAQNISSPHGIKIMTAHKCKGLEFERVLVTEVDEKFESDHLLYYVACTRAKNFLLVQKAMPKKGDL